MGLHIALANQRPNSLVKLNSNFSLQFLIVLSDTHTNLLSIWIFCIFYPIDYFHFHLNRVCKLFNIFRICVRFQPQNFLNQVFPIKGI